MIYSVLQIEKDLKNNELKNLYLLYGEEQYLIDNSTKKIKKIFRNLVDGLNYIKIENGSADSIISEIQTPPFGYERKLILIKNDDLLKKQTRKNQNIKDEIEKLADFIDENTDIINGQNIIVFILNDANIDKNKLYKSIEKNGIVCNFEHEKQNELVNRIKFICNAYSINIDMPTTAYFIDCCGNDLQNLINEIRKLIEYVGKGGTITKNDIDLLCIRQLDSIIFDLTDNLGIKNTSKALQVLQNLIYEKEPVQRILITLYNHFKKLYIVKLCDLYKQDIKENLNLKPNQNFLVNKYKKQAEYFSQNELNNILLEFIDLDEKSKTGDIDLNVGLESVICGMK